MNLPVGSADPPVEAGEHLRIAETFTSIQGEGRLSGVASYFIRVSGCNLRCSWCDTPYASWRPEGDIRPIGELADAASGSGVRHIVLTGGEPMLFPAVVPLTRLLRDAGLHITIETAGTIHRVLDCDLMSISPKLANSVPGGSDSRDPSGAWRVRHESRRINPVTLQSLIDSYAERQFKFVVSHPDDIAEIEGILALVRGWQAWEIQLMPEGVTPPSPETSRWIAEICIARGWRYCRRLHIDLFGNVRGT